MTPQVPPLAVSAGWLRKFGEAVEVTWCEDDRSLAVIGMGGDGTRFTIRRPGEALKLPRLLLVLTSDPLAQEVIDHDEARREVLQDGGPKALWKLADAVTEDDWLWSAETIGQRAAKLAKAVLASGLVVRRGNCETAAAVAAAAQILMDTGSADRMELARRAMLLPLPYLTRDGLPVMMPTAVRTAVPEHAVKVFRAAAFRLREDRRVTFPPHPPPRPILLSKPLPTSDHADEKEVERYNHLADEVPRLPAPDASDVARRLTVRFPWLGSAIGVVKRELALLPPGAPAVLAPLLLLGPPGSGKSTFLKAVCQEIGIPWRILHSADGNGAVTLAGNGRGWRSGRPALPIMFIAESAVSTIGLIVDDIDRQASDDRYGTPQSWLLSVLEPGTAQAYQDPFLLCQADLRTVSWFLTANDEAGIAGALLDRVVTIEVGYPPPEVAPVILETAVKEVLSELGWSDGAPALPAAARDLLLRSFKRDSSTLRLMRRAVRAALGAVRCGDDPTAAVQAELERGRVRNDRAYGAAGRIGFIPPGKREN